MSDDSPGPSLVVQLMPEPRTKNLNLCIICQHSKDSKGTTKLTSTEEGRKVLIQTSRLLQNDVITNLPENDLSRIQYHVKTCHATYKRKGERYKEKQPQK